MLELCCPAKTEKGIAHALPSDGTVRPVPRIYPQFIPQGKELLCNHQFLSIFLYLAYVSGYTYVFGGIPRSVNIFNSFSKIFIFFAATK